MEAVLREGPAGVLIATAAFGIEGITAQELRALGYSGLAVENGRVSFAGKAADIARCNIGLRTADRLLVKMAEFTATDFEELFQQTKKVEWETFIPEDGKMHVTGKSIGSKLASVPDCQSIVKKAIVEAMRRRYPGAWFAETGPVYRIEAAIVSDRVTLTIDTTGPGLHKRGHLTARGEAPLKETLAAAMIYLSRWRPGRELADPFCGSGTIPIEAALMGRNIAPGIGRSFVSESWPSMPAAVWREARREARASERKVPLEIRASDADPAVLEIARQNAARSGLSQVLSFRKASIEEFSSTARNGCIVCNPPYGMRTGGAQVEKIYRTLGEVYRRLPGWSLFALSPHPDFEKLFGRRADRKRKLYNGNIECNLFQYFGPRI
jgi:putative N6-adenine-specific DNA methylase